MDETTAVLCVDSTDNLHLHSTPPTAPSHCYLRFFILPQLELLSAFQHLFSFYQDLSTEDPTLPDLRHRNIHRFQSTSQIPSIIQTYFPTYIPNKTRLEDNSYSHPSEYPPPRCSKLSTYALPKILHHPS